MDMRLSLMQNLKRIKFFIKKNRKMWIVARIVFSQSEGDEPIHHYLGQTLIMSKKRFREVTLCFTLHAFERLILGFFPIKKCWFEKLYSSSMGPVYERILTNLVILSVSCSTVLNELLHYLSLQPPWQFRNIILSFHMTVMSTLLESLRVAFSSKTANKHNWHDVWHSICLCFP